MKEIKDKIYRKCHTFFFEKINPGDWVLNCYSAYRHYKRWKKNISNKIDIKPSEWDLSTIYLTQQPNKGAGIGHQLGNWNSGCYYAKYFGVKYAYSSFASESWDCFLGFSEGEVSREELLRNGYKRKRLPYFDAKKESDVQMIKGIIHSYSGQKILFELELDQFYEEQHGVMDFIQKKFYTAKARNNDQLIYEKDVLNIAVHIRRGDITAGQTNNDPALTKRWVNNEYYEHLIGELVNLLPDDRKYHLWIFSQGTEDDFKELQKYEHLTFCFDMNAQDSFLHMVYADILITSKSSFSYKPALLSKGIRLVPSGFWHGYPADKQWIVVNADGTLNMKQREVLKELLN